MHGTVLYVIKQPCITHILYLKATNLNQRAIPTYHLNEDDGNDYYLSKNLIYKSYVLGGFGATLATVLFSANSSYSTVSSVAIPHPHPNPSITNTNMFYDRNILLLVCEREMI